MNSIRCFISIIALSMSLLVGCSKTFFTLTVELNECEPDTLAVELNECEPDTLTNVTRDILKNLGVNNALKKAAQMREVEWKAIAKGMPSNYGPFVVNSTYRGIPYSSVLEYNQHVFLDVSLETFITATRNPRSVLYSENVSSANSRSSLGREYHGLNCACYYGSTCSYLIVYALGLPFGIAASEFPKWDEMEVISNQSANGVKLADVLSSSGHVSLVTDIKKDKDGVISMITITENAATTTSSKNFSPQEFDDYLSSGYKILRYKHIENNTQYTPLTDFVAVDGETKGNYSFNDDICPNYGNKSNYAEGDVVVLNLREDYQTKGYTNLLVYKDNQLYINISVDTIDIELDGLPYGDYKALLTTNVPGNQSPYAYFKVVNMSVSIDCDGGNDYVCFSSANATPVYYDFCRESGNKGPNGVNGILSHLLTPSELYDGKAELIPPLVITEDYPYIKVHFETEYGRTVKAVKKCLNE